MLPHMQTLTAFCNRTVPLTASDNLGKSSRVGTNNDVCLQTNYHSSIDGNNNGSDDFFQWEKIMKCLIPYWVMTELLLNDSMGIVQKTPERNISAQREDI